MTEPVSGPETVTVAVLAGGRGSRLGGVAKASLDVGGLTLLDRVLRSTASLAVQTLAIVNDDRLAGDPRLRLLRDPAPHAGVLPALLQALDAATTPLLLLVACDMPFLSPPVLRRLVDLAADADVVIPMVDGVAQPMHAIYRVVACRQAIRAALDRGDPRMISFLDDVRTVRVPEEEIRAFDPALRSFFNVNTPDDLAEARRIANARD